MPRPTLAVLAALCAAALCAPARSGAASAPQRVIRLMGAGPKSSPITTQAIRVASGGDTGSAPVAPSLIFQAGFDDGTSIPPDVSAAVGPQEIIVAHNDGVWRYDKSGGSLEHLSSLYAFWGTQAYDSQSTFDPKVYYDELSQRFFMVAVDSADSLSNLSAILVAVSTGSNPSLASAGWSKFHFYVQTGCSATPCWADYPQVGFNSRWLAVTTNMFSAQTEAFQQTVIWVFDVANLVSATPSLGLDGRFPNPTLTGDPGSPFTVQPAVTYDSSQADLFFVDSTYGGGSPPSDYTSGSSKAVRLSKITGTTFAPSYVTGASAASGLLAIPVSHTGAPPNASQKQSFACPSGLGSCQIDTNDQRVINVVERNDTVYAVFGADVSGDAGVVWLKADVSAGTASSFSGGAIYDSSDLVSYYDPSIGVDPNGNVVLGFTSSSGSSYASAMYATITPAGTVSAPYRYYAGKTTYDKDFGLGDIRWGDFSAAVPDPAAVGTLWTLQEYADSTGACSQGVVDNGCWGTAMAKVSVVSPPASAVTGITAANGSPPDTQLSWTWPLLSDATYYLVYGYNSSTYLGQVDPAAGATSATFTGTYPSNTLENIVVYGANSAGVGPSSTGTFAATYAPAYAGGSPTVQVWVTSMTVAYGGCSGACSGYELDAAQSSSFAAPVYSSATGNSALTTLTVSGLSANTAYYLRVGDNNVLAQPNYSSSPSEYGPYTTQNALLQPAGGAFSNVGTSQIQANWSSNGNGFGTTYVARAFSNSAHTSQVGPDSGGLNVFSALFTSLSPGTSYWFGVMPEQGLATGTTLYWGPQATESAQPAAAGTSLSASSVGQLTASWLSNGNGGAAVYQVELSSYSDFSRAVSSARTQSLSAAIGGLASNQLYYGRVKALSTDGTSSAYLSLGSKTTLGAAPSITGFSGVGTAGWTVSYTNGGNAGSPTYRLQLDRWGTFAAPQATLSSGGLSAAFTGLQANTSYYVRVAAVNADGAVGPYGSASAQWTAPLAPAAAAGSAQSVSQVTFAWAAGGNPSQTDYFVELHALSDYSDAPLQSGLVAAPALSRAFSGLAANQPYYGRVRAVGSGGNADSAWTPLGELSTLTAGLGSAPTLDVVLYTSATVSWTPLPSSPQAATCEGYRIDASTDSLFRGTLYTALIPGAASRGGSVPGLPPATVLYLRVGPANWDGASAPTAVAGSATTLTQNAVSALVGSSGASLSIAPLLPPLTQVQLSVPAASLPSGTQVVLNTSIEYSLPAASSNEAALTSLGSAAGFEVTAGGEQPAVPVPVSFVYDPTKLPAGVDPKTIQLARYDDAAGQWTLLPTVVDESQHRVSAELTHFSLYAPFAVGAGSDLSNVSIFPIPWEIGSSDPRFAASELTMTSLPPEARVRIFSIRGELVWEANAQSNGVLNWSGNNRFGRPAGSGTYLVVIEGAGRRIVRRAVVVR